MGLLSFDDGLNRLFDAQVDDFIAIISENDINQIFANIMHIAFHRSDQELRLG